MRTHGVGLPSEDQLSESPCPVPYIVGFEAPVVICSPEVDLLKEPLKLRWVPPSAAGLFGGSSLSSSAASASSGTGSTSGSSSAGSSRARSLSGAGGAGDRHGPGPGDVDFAAGDVVMINGDVGGGGAAGRFDGGGGGGRRRALNGIHLFRSTSADWETTPSTTSWSESPSGPPSPDSCGESDVIQTNNDNFFKSFRNHRRVESERLVFFNFCFGTNTLCILVLSRSWRLPASKR